MTRQSVYHLPLLIATLATILGPDIVLAAGPGVHGRVLGHDEQGSLLGVVAGAKIEFRGSGGGNVVKAAADDKGYYKVDLPPGDYLYKLEATGYRKEDVGRGLKLTQSEGYAIFNLAMTKGKDVAPVKPREIPVRKVGKLHGRVFEKTPSGLVGIGDARINLRREGSRELATIRSRGTAEGQHQIGDYEVTLEAGKYHASVSANGFEALIDPASIEVATGGDAKRDFVLTRVKPAENKDQGIRGVVTIIDSGATPPPIKIQIATLGSSQPRIDVNQGSNVSFAQELPPGRYRVTASAEGFPTTESPPIYVFEGRYTRVNLALRAQHVPEPKTTLEVFVYAKTSNADETPLPGATVSLLKKGADPVSAKESTTDATGHAIFPVDEGGEFVATAHLKEYRAGSGQGAVVLGQSHEVAIELVKETEPATEIALSAIVTDAVTKRPLSGARVLARHPAQTLAEAARGTTDTKGEATLHVTREGNYTVLAQIAGYEPGGMQTMVRATQSNRAVLALKPIAIVVRPVQPEPKPPAEVEPSRTVVSGYAAYREASGQLRSVPGVSLFWDRVGPNQPRGTQLSTTGNNGKYQIEVPTGQYQVRVEPPAGFERLTERVDVSSGAHEKYFILRRAERLTPEPNQQLIDVTGQVVVEISPGRFAGVSKAEIVFARGGGVTRAVSSMGGNFAQRLPPDHYLIHVRAVGYEPLDSEVNVRAGISPLQLILKRTARPTPQPDPAAGSLLNLMVVERRLGIVDRNLPPLAGAQVQISQSGRPISTGQTSASGRYSVHVKPGSYTIGVGKAGYAKASAEVTVADRDVTQQVILIRGAEPGPEPSPKPTLSVHVARRADSRTTMIKPSGTALSGTEVTIMRGTQRIASGTTNAAGNYSVQLPAGNYAVKAYASGYAPAGKSVTLSDRDGSVSFQLERTPSGASSSSSTEGPRPAGSGGSGRGPRDQPTQSPPQTWYIVEHRDNQRSPWVELGRYRTQREAQYALFRAVERRQIPGAAPAESRIRTVTLASGSDDRNRPPRR